jgi:hypothetical protein
MSIKQQTTDLDEQLLLSLLEVDERSSEPLTSVFVSFETSNRGAIDGRQ